MLVPNTAIVRSTEREYVVTVTGGKVTLVDIKEGLASHDSTEVFGKMKPGDKIVLHPLGRDKTRRQYSINKK